MAPRAKPVSVSFWLLSLCSPALAGVHRLSCYQLISPWAAPGLPKRLNVMKVNDLMVSAYDSGSGKLDPRNGYPAGDQDRHQFWSESTAWYLAWDSWVENEYQGLVREMNTSSLRADSCYLQIQKSCELDDDSGTTRATTRYSLNGQDLLQYRADQNRWFSVHPAAWRVAERWNRQGDTFAAMKVHTLHYCRFLFEKMAPFTAQKTARPAARVALVPGTQDRPSRLICHVTGFYPRDIEVTWERGGRGAQGEQVTSGIQPNADPTFQVRVSIELGQEGVGPTEHVCVVRHSSLGDAPLRVTWDSQSTAPVGLPVIVAGAFLAVLGAGALGWYLRRRKRGQNMPYRPAQTQPGSLDSASDTAKPAEGAFSMATFCPDAAE
ncbi:HLA class II histocompatibility antigen, DP beta 1 chain-like [Emydura macquarii macquarii]|uniref:HLA class II histocompatibility antigen, DP beta 1 chain-like n=1 Tax=Emydura macquarii macquarii TaxID=1129001 RepID=UPI00352ABE0F